MHILQQRRDKSCITTLTQHLRVDFTDRNHGSFRSVRKAFPRYTAQQVCSVSAGTIIPIDLQSTTDRERSSPPAFKAFLYLCLSTICSLRWILAPIRTTYLPVDAIACICTSRPQNPLAVLSTALITCRQLDRHAVHLVKLSEPPATTGMAQTVPSFWYVPHLSDSTPGLATILLVTDLLIVCDFCRVPSLRALPPSTYKESSLEVGLVEDSQTVAALCRIASPEFVLQTTDGTQLVCQLIPKRLPGTIDYTTLLPSSLKAVVKTLTQVLGALLQIQDSGGHPRQVGNAWCSWNLAARDPREVRRH